MAVTTSCHMGTTISFGHNARDERIVSKEEHIKQDGYHYTFRNSVGDKDITLRGKYDRIFGEATEAYNSKQKRDDRKITSYYDKIKAQQIKSEQTGNKSGKKLAYEMILAIGDYTNYNKGMNDEQIEADKAVKLLKQTCHEIIRENPHLKCVGVYIHADEYHKEVINGEEVEVMGAPHAHFDFVPVADGYKKGLSVQNGLSKALEQDGYIGSGIKDTPQMAFQRAVLAKLDAKAKELGLEVTHPIRDGKIEVEHLDKNEYILNKQRDKLAEIREQKQVEGEKLAKTNAKLAKTEAGLQAMQRKQHKSAALDELVSKADAVLKPYTDAEEADELTKQVMERFDNAKKGLFSSNKGKFTVTFESKEELDHAKILIKGNSLLKKLSQVKDKLLGLFTARAESQAEKEAEIWADRREFEKEQEASKDEIERVMSGQEYKDKKAEVDKENKLLNDITDQRADSLRELLKVQRQLREAQRDLGEYKAKKRNYYEEQFLAKHKDEFDEYVEEEQERLEREEDEYYL